MRQSFSPNSPQAQLVEALFDADCKGIESIARNQAAANEPGEEYSDERIRNDVWNTESGHTQIQKDNKPYLCLRIRQAVIVQNIRVMNKLAQISKNA